MPQPENKFKTYDVNGRKMIFNAELFGDLFMLTAKEKNIRYGKYEILLSEKLNVSKDTVHGWRFRKFAPGDIELVKMLAAELGTDLEKLLKEKKEMSAEQKKFNDVTRIKVAEVYKILSPYFEDCRENFEKYGEIGQLIYKADDLILKYTPDDKNLEKMNALLQDYQSHLENYYDLYLTKASAIIRALKLNMLELPEFIYEKWIAQLDEIRWIINDLLADNISTIEEILQLLDFNDDYIDVEDYVEGDEMDIRDHSNMLFNDILSCYNGFIQFCKEEIWPMM